jgi:site-specific DNA recombinase
MPDTATAAERPGLVWEAEGEVPEGVKVGISYLRVSTVAQSKRAGSTDEGYSIPAQREANRNKAASVGAVVVAEFLDKGESAKAANRPGLQALLAYLTEHPNIDFVIIPKVDRWARNRYDDALLGIAVKKAGAQLVSATENIDDTPSGQLVHGILAVIADFYVRNLAAEALKGMTQKAKLGGTPHKAKIGYLNVRRTVEGYEIRTVAVDPERAPHVTWAFEAYATGEYSLSRLLHELTERGLRTVPGRKRPSRPLQRSYLANILRSRYYLGFVTFKGIEYKGDHERLVTPEVFERVQTLLDANRQGEKRQKHHHYLKSTLWCEHCGSRLCFARCRGHGGVYDYFFCLGKQRGVPCSQRHLPVDEIEAEVERVYDRVSLTPEEAATVADAVRAKLDGQRERQDKEAEQQRRRLARLSDERAKLLQAHYADAVPLDLLRSEQHRITREITNAEATLTTCEAVLPELDTTMTRALALATDCKTTYRTSGHHDRRDLNRFFFDRLRVAENKTVAEVRPTEPMSYLFDRSLPNRLDEEIEDPDPSSWGRGLRITTLVGERGLEPPRPKAVTSPSS